MINEIISQRLEEIVQELGYLSAAFTPMYGGSNLREEIKRMADGLGTATHELSRIAASLEIIQQALTD